MRKPGTTQSTTQRGVLTGADLPTPCAHTARPHGPVCLSCGLPVTLCDSPEGLQVPGGQRCCPLGPSSWLFWNILRDGSRRLHEPAAQCPWSASDPSPLLSPTRGTCCLTADSGPVRPLSSKGGQGSGMGVSAWFLGSSWRPVDHFLKLLLHQIVLLAKALLPAPQPGQLWVGPTGCVRAGAGWAAPGCTP